MKGKIMLQDITSPVEGMQIIIKSEYSKPEYIGTINAIGGNVIGTVFQIKSEDGQVRPCSKDVLKQIVVEYYKTTTTQRDGILPLHPDDWKWAVEHIGEEVEWDRILPKDKVGCEIHAKLIYTTPIIYPSHEPHDNIIYYGKEVELLMNSLYWDARKHVNDTGKIGAKWFYNWWNKHKKK